MQTVICSHGFGVRANARGLFTDIEKSFADHAFVMFDYNSIDNDGNTVVPTLAEQVTKLQQVIDDSPNGSILLCHSQGSIIAGLVDLNKISKVVILAPPVMLSMTKIINKMMKKPGSIISLNGYSKLPRSDGAITYVPNGYAESLLNIDPIELYSNIAYSKPVVIVRSLNDEVVGYTNVDDVRSAQIIDVVADHNFTGASRQALIAMLHSIF